MNVFGVFLPRAFVEYEDTLKRDTQDATLRFMDDGSGTHYSIEGDKLDRTLVRAGLGVSGVLPNGWSGFIAYSEEFMQDETDQYQFNAGLQLEF